MGPGCSLFFSAADLRASGGWMQIGCCQHARSQCNVQHSVFKSRINNMFTELSAVLLTTLHLGAGWRSALLSQFPRRKGVKRREQSIFPDSYIYVFSWGDVSLHTRLTFPGSLNGWHRNCLECFLPNIAP